MGRGKHASDSEIDLSGIPFKQIVIGIIIVIVLFGIGFGGFKLVKKLTSSKPKEPVNEEVVSGLVKDLEGFEVLGKVKIEKLNIDTYILNSCEDKALELAAGKIHGKKLNENGNFSIVGHNYDKIFAKLLEIEKGEEIIVVDQDEKETKYEVVDVYPVEPDDLKPLLDVENKTRITLITCENTAQTRLVVVADKKE